MLAIMGENPNRPSNETVTGIAICTLNLRLSQFEPASGKSITAEQECSFRKV